MYNPQDAIDQLNSELTIELALTIRLSQMNYFKVPEESILELKKNVPLSERCNEVLDESFVVEDAVPVELHGSFVKFSGLPNMNYAKWLIIELVGRRKLRLLRLGTAKEAMAYVMQGNPHPEYFVVLQKSEQHDYILVWNKKEFEMSTYGYELLPEVEVFVVREPGQYECWQFRCDQKTLVEYLNQRDS